MLAKRSGDDPSEWPTYLPLALWAKRITVCASTRYSTFELVYGGDYLLPVESTVQSWMEVE